MNGRTTYFNQYPMPQMYDYPFHSMLTEWSPLVPYVYAPPILPVAVISPSIIAPLCPYTGALVTEPVIPIVPVAVEVTPAIFDNFYNYVDETNLICTENSVSPEALSDKVEYFDEDAPKREEEHIDKALVNPIELYLSLPKEFFPTANMLSIDSNLVIEEFCKLESISENVSWILDLEFGVPRVPITRAIAIYDVKFNSINCKNTPGAIHPGFEKCNDDFKRIILFYYDCIVSNWYNGYLNFNDDKSVVNFQSWLQIPMQYFGMCWP